MSFPDKALGEPEPYYQQKLDELSRSLNTDQFTMGFVTDAHFDFGTWRKNAFLSLRNLNNVLSLSEYLDVLICGGDNVDSEQASHQQKIDNMSNYLSFFYTDSGVDKFAVRGNHDQGGLVHFNSEGKVMPEKVISDAEFKKYMKTAEKMYGETRDGDSLYGYKDYSEDGIRVVFVDSLDIPETLNSDGSLKYIAQWDYGYRDKQLKWIAEEALGNCPEDYHILMVSHVPLRLRSTDEPRNKRNFDLLIDLINAFVTKKEITLHSELTDFEVESFTVDFSNRSESNFIGFIAGHDHSESVINNGNFKTIVCDNAWPESDSFIQTYKEDSFTVLQVDKENRKLNLKGFGRATNRTVDY
ncbi:Ser/Thr phosphatase family protein [Enterococcus faecalis 13-SD-W-01]|nr:Ser/Thr phosphatase family protein [Enterococcus faecalis 13-SD-W-01]